MIISMSVSMIGLSKIIKYGYGYCGYLGIAIIIIPFLTVESIRIENMQTENNFTVVVKGNQAFAK